MIIVFTIFPYGIWHVHSLRFFFLHFGSTSQPFHIDVTGTTNQAGGANGDNSEFAPFTCADDWGPEKHQSLIIGGYAVTTDLRLASKVMHCSAASDTPCAISFDSAVGGGKTERQCATDLSVINLANNASV